MNEILIIITLLFSFSSAIILAKLFGKGGLFVWIAISSVFANIEVTVLVHAFGMEQTLGNALFASSFLATDILSEIYGKKDANKGVFIGIATTILFILFSFMWIHYVPSENDISFEAVKKLFTNTPRILLASLLGYAVSQLFDVWIYHKWWNFTEKKTGNRQKYLWLRNNFSTMLSQLINIVIFNFGAFLGIYTINQLIEITLSCYIIYIFTSLLDTPFLYLSRKILSENQSI